MARLSQNQATIHTTCGAAMSKISESVKYAYGRGYRVAELGAVVSPSGRTRKQRLSGTCGGSRPAYWRFNVKYQGVSRPIPVHKLAAYQKFGDSCFDEGNVVRHLDGDPRNNSLSNIGIGSVGDNIMDRSDSSRYWHSVAASANSGRTKLNPSQVREIRDTSQSVTALALKFGVVKSTICHVRSGLTHRHVAG